MPARPLVRSLLCPALWHVGGHGGREGPGCRAGCRGDGRGEGRACHFSWKHPGESSTGVERVCLEGGTRVGVLSVHVSSACQHPGESSTRCSTSYVRTHAGGSQAPDSGVLGDVVGCRPTVCAPTAPPTRCGPRAAWQPASTPGNRPFCVGGCRPSAGRTAVHRCAPDAGGSQAPDPGKLGDAIRVGMPAFLRMRPRRGAAHVSAGQFDARSSCASGQGRGYVEGEGWGERDGGRRAMPCRATTPKLNHRRRRPPQT